MFPDLTRDDVFRLETSRLWLRWPRMADAAAIQRLAGEKAVAEMTGTVPHPYPDGAAEPFIFNTRKGNALGDHLALAITMKNRPNDVIGMIGVHPKAGGQPFIGYWLGIPHWRQGLATEASQSIIDAVFAMTDVGAIDSYVRVINPASRRVLEKCGFRHEGSNLRALPARGGLFPCDQFRLERSTWLALKSWSATGLGAIARQSLAPRGAATPEAAQRADCREVAW